MLVVYRQLVNNGVRINTCGLFCHHSVHELHVRTTGFPWPSLCDLDFDPIDLQNSKSLFHKCRKCFCKLCLNSLQHYMSIVEQSITQNFHDNRSVTVTPTFDPMPLNFFSNVHPRDKYRLHCAKEFYWNTPLCEESASRGIGVNKWPSWQLENNDAVRLLS